MDDPLTREERSSIFNAEGMNNQGVQEAAPNVEFDLIGLGD